MASEFNQIHDADRWPVRMDDYAAVGLAPHCHLIRLPRDNDFAIVQGIFRGWVVEHLLVKESGKAFIRCDASTAGGKRVRHLKLRGRHVNLA